MKQCPNKDCVGVYIQSTDTHCYKCGAKLQESEKCQCGQSIGRVDNFCVQCGRPCQKGEGG